MAHHRPRFRQRPLFAARADQHEERRPPRLRLGIRHANQPRPRSHSHRRRWRDVHLRLDRQGLRSRRQNRKRTLELRSARGPARQSRNPAATKSIAASPSGTAKFTLRASTASSTRSMPPPAKSSGRPTRSPTRRSATPSAALRKSPATWSSSEMPARNTTRAATSAPTISTPANSPGASTPFPAIRRSRRNLPSLKSR